MKEDERGARPGDPEDGREEELPPEASAAGESQETPGPDSLGVPLDTDLPDAAESVDLVNAGLAGDGEAINEIFRRYQPRLRRIVRARVPPNLRVHFDPDDVVQETSMIVLEKLPGFEFREPSSLLRWMCRIADFVIKNRIASTKAQKRDPARERRIRTSDTSVDQSGVFVSARGPTPSQEFSQREVEDVVDFCVAELEPEVFGRVVLMRDYLGMEWDEIQDELQRPTVDAVRELHRRAHARLVEAVQRRGLRPA
jgi:RNA polymerase sigma factor (sigma-70 family)